MRITIPDHIADRIKQLTARQWTPSLPSRQLQLKQLQEKALEAMLAGLDMLENDAKESDLASDEFEIPF